MEEIHELLGIPKIKIYQNDELNSFSVDSMILGSFATIKKSTKRILDLGTGNAPIPLYLTLRTDAKIFGVEIQQELYKLAVKSVKINMKEEQINLICDDLKNISNHFDLHTFDLVVSNPPFFKANEDSHINPNEVKAIARHEIKANLDDFIQCASLMLKNGGFLSIVHRPDRLSDIICTMRKYKIEPKRIRFVYPDEYSESNQVLVEGIYCGKLDGLKILKPLYIHPKFDINKDEIVDIYNGEQKE